MRTILNSMILPAVALSAMAPSAAAQDNPFPKGELSTTKNHTGDVWLKELSAGDPVIDPGIASATFGPGAKLDWHVHPGGQVLLVTEGTGFYQEKGKPARLVHRGDVIKALPGVEHWHGATPTTGFTYLAVTPTKQGKTIWRKPVTDAEYASARK